MSAETALLVAVVFMTATTAPVAVVHGVRINYVRVPQAVRNNSGRPVVLDCDYTVKPDDAGLVIKWFLNGAPAAVYQWIPPKRPQGLGLLRGRLDLAYRVSDDPNTMHRALKILNPTTDISGEYKCSVSTFNDEDFSIRHMIVFEPERELVLRQSAPLQGQVNISCSATAVYPEPQIALFKDPDRNNREQQEQLSGAEVVSVRRERDGRYDVTASISIDAVDLSPAVSSFHCEMRIPKTGYSRRVTRLYHPLGSDFSGGTRITSPSPLNLWPWGFVYAISLIARHFSFLLCDADDDEKY